MNQRMTPAEYGKWLKAESNLEYALGTVTAHCKAYHLPTLEKSIDQITAALETIREHIAEERALLKEDFSRLEDYYSDKRKK